ncbi:U2 small nuclear ribonucleo protein B [Aaosphaeria arxii CBS 175.79]|uniref:U2 small nuclear ribonucleo protein B n=1 Tax=Aaosphaeria arxii CBS 175.79 TaxID=1450172 RepID=A0A6A5Y3B5_9PLEO|nr:U2 small nuclear ribonucleo protein B [Aaosphaeria arxii CBS 175.79]KAF2019948.1 U2 small nuclear ribonucleo protein B [Aaosphaeria arxii CBS 175.79]
MDKMEGVVSGPVDPSRYPVPIETIYVNNLEERVKVETLKEALRAIFSHYGTIVDIIAKTSVKRKGQAFIVFDSQKSALEAVEEMTGFELYGKSMKVQMAKTHSDATIERKASDQLDQHKRERLTLKERKLAEEASKAKKLPHPADKPRIPKTGAAAIPDEYVRPNKVLFLQNIPKDVDADDLTAIFEAFPGFKEVRFVAIRAVGFAEFENEQFAITAKEAMANKPVGAEGKIMKVTYQRQ